MVCTKGRPKDTQHCTQKELDCYDLLDGLSVEYDRVEHPPADNMERCKEIDTVLGAVICKNLFLCNRQGTKFYLLMLPEDKAFRTKDLSSQIQSSRLSFGKAEQMEELLGCTPGSASVLGLQYDMENKVQLLIYKELLGQAYFGCHPCVNTASLKLATADLLQTILPALHHTPMVVELPRETES